MKTVLSTTDTFVIRQPLYPINNIFSILDNPSLMSDLFRSDKFKRSIIWVSAELYREYQKYTKGELNPKDMERMTETLLKYAFRMSTRPTPFGEFASIGLATRSNFTKINNPGIRRRWITLDAALEEKFATKINKAEDFNRESTAKMALNGTIICKGANMFYLRASEAGKQLFCAIEFNPIIEALLKKSKKIYTVNELTDLIFRNQDMDEPTKSSFISKLRSLDIIVPSCRREAMSESWIKRIKKIKTDSENKVTNVRTDLRLMETSKNTEEIESALQSVKNEILDGTKNIKNVVQSVTYSTRKQPIANSIVEKVIDAIPFLSKIGLRESLNTNLKKFIQNFQNRYEQRSIPLLEILNPEIGIGYGDSIYPKSNDLILNIETNSKGKSTEYIFKDEFENILNQKVIQSKGKQICLTDKDVERLESRIDRMPATMSAVFSLIGEENNIISELHISGTSASCLLGRFTLGDKNVHNLVKTIADHEQKYYDAKGIVAEINLLPNLRSGNVNYRSRFRQYRICAVHSQSKHDIPLSALHVSIENGVVKLKDFRNGKYVIPRLSSAHNNYAGTDVIYKFLGDIQCQTETNQMNFSWGNLRRFYRHLPRVCYNDIILGLEEWSVTTASLKDNNTISFEKYMEWVNDNNLPQYVKLIDGDNELLVDHRCELSVRILLHEMKNKSTVYLREYPDICFAKNAKNIKYCNQIIIPIFKNKII